MISLSFQSKPIKTPMSFSIGFTPKKSKRLSNFIRRKKPVGETPKGTPKSTPKVGRLIHLFENRSSVHPSPGPVQPPQPIFDTPNDFIVTPLSSRRSTFKLDSKLLFDSAPPKPRRISFPLKDLVNVANTPDKRTKKDMLKKIGKNCLQVVDRVHTLFSPLEAKKKDMAKKAVKRISSPQVTKRPNDPPLVKNNLRLSRRKFTMDL